MNDNTDYYADTYTRLYQVDEKTREACVRVPPALEMVKTLDPQPVDALDIGCGNGKLVAGLRARGIMAIGLDVADIQREFDPAWFVRGNMLNTGFEPRAADLLTCLDTIEHLKPEDLDRGFREIVRIASRWVIFSYGLGREPVSTVKPEGVERLHEIVKPFDWWLGKTAEHGLRLVRARVLNSRQNVTLWEVGRCNEAKRPTSTSNVGEAKVAKATGDQGPQEVRS